MFFRSQKFETPVEVSTEKEPASGYWLSAVGSAADRGLLPSD